MILDYFKVKKRLEYVEFLVRKADKLFKSFSNPSIYDYIKLKKKVYTFYEDEMNNPYDGAQIMLKGLNQDYNKGVLKPLFNSFQKRLIKDNIDVNSLLNFKIPEFEEKIVNEYQGDYVVKDEFLVSKPEDFKERPAIKEEFMFVKDEKVLNEMKKLQGKHEIQPLTRPKVREANPYEGFSL